MPNTPSNIDQAAIWAAAIEGLEIQKKRIEDQIAAVKSLLERRRRRIRFERSPPQRPSARIKKCRQSGSSGRSVRRAEEARSQAGPQETRTLSPEARARISEAQKKRWAEHNKK